MARTLKDGNDSEHRDPVSCRLALACSQMTDAHYIRRKERDVATSRDETRFAYVPSLLLHRRIVKIPRGARGLILLLLLRDVRRRLHNNHLANPLGILRLRVAGQQGLLHGIIAVTHPLAPAFPPGRRDAAAGDVRETRQDLRRYQGEILLGD